MTDTPDTPRAGRAIISNPPGEMPVLTLYRAADALALVDLDPATCVALARDLLECACLSIGVQN